MENWECWTKQDLQKGHCPHRKLYFTTHDWSNHSSLPHGGISEVWTLSSPLVDDLSIAWIVQIRPFPSGDWRYCMRVVLASLYLISVNPLKIEVYTHITCLTHTLLTHKGSPVLIIYNLYWVCLSYNGTHRGKHGYAKFWTWPPKLPGPPSSFLDIAIQHNPLLRKNRPIAMKASFTAKILNISYAFIGNTAW